MKRRSISSTHTVGMSQSFQETQCFLYAAREISKRRLPMVWEMAGSHRAQKAHSTAWPDSVPTKLVAYFLISKKGKGGREGSKEKSPVSLPLKPCWGNHWSIALPNESCIHCWRTGEGVLMVDPGAASPNPTPNLLHMWSVCLMARENRSFQNENIFDPKRIQNSIMVK